jgi:prophage regulatory protein
MSAAENTPTPLSLLPIKAVKVRVGLSESTIYRMLNLGTFPKPRKVGFKSLWRSDELEAWIMAQGFESDTRQDAAA